MHSLYKEKRNNIYKLIEVHFFLIILKRIQSIKKAKKKKKRNHKYLFIKCISTTFMLEQNS
jgi:hypothetical protein